MPLQSIIYTLCGFFGSHIIAKYIIGNVTIMQNMIAETCTLSHFFFSDSMKRHTTIANMQNILHFLKDIL
jgi:hypothetical protein